MARVFITGSGDGVGRMAAQLLLKQGHGVVLHARDQQRADAAMAAGPGGGRRKTLRSSRNCSMLAKVSRE